MLNRMQKNIAAPHVSTIQANVARLIRGSLEGHSRSTAPLKPGFQL
jgi:hypothetical protein